MDWFLWSKKKPQQFHNIYVFLEYFLCFFFQWLASGCIYEILKSSGALHVSQYSYCLLFILPPPTALCNKTFFFHLTMHVLYFVVNNYSFCCLLTTWFFPSKVNVVYKSAYSNCCCWQSAYSICCWEFCPFHLLLLVWCWQLYPFLLLSCLSSSLIPPIFCTCGPLHWSLVSALCNIKYE